MKAKKDRKLKGLTRAGAVVMLAAAISLPTGVLASPSLQFENFLKNTGNEAVEALEDNAPREVEVHAPEKFINNIEIIHSKPEALLEGSVALTNIDVVTTGSDDVEKINVVALNSNGSSLGKRENVEPYEAGNQNKFHVGFANLTENFDIKVEVLDDAGKVIDSKIFKIPSETNDVFRISQNYSYVTSGKDYTLYQLLANNNLFTNLLQEHNLEDLTYSKENQ